MGRLNDKRAVITGAARGIGEGIARAFHAQGARVIVTDKDADGAKALAQDLDAESVTLDVSREADWDALAALYPTVDIVVNNAGVTGFEDGIGPHDPENASLADWRAVHAVNTDGTFLGCRYAIRAMRNTAGQGGAGAIVNISSRSGLVGIPGAAAYAASKAAIRNHTKSVALYCAQAGLDIRCNSVHPAAILTPMWEPMLGDPATQTQAERNAAMAALVKDTPMQRFGTVEEVAALCVLLASDEARYITGAEMTIDGGLLAGSAASPG